MRNTQKTRTKNLADKKEYRRELRTEGTKAEATLWKVLRAKQVDGLQFRRQFSIGNHILDFYCPSIRLAIELDGDYHYHVEQPVIDFERDMELLNEYGIKTLRFENKTVFKQQYVIINAIIQAKTEFEAAGGHTPPALRATSPNLGEDKTTPPLS